MYTFKLDNEKYKSSLNRVSGHLTQYLPVILCSICRFYQSIVLAPWYVSNASIIHRDLIIRTVTEETSQISSKYQTILNKHENYLAMNQLDSRATERLKRGTILEFTSRFTT